MQRALQALKVHGLVQEIAEGGGRTPAVYRLVLPQGIRQARRIPHGKAERQLASQDRERGGGEDWRDHLTAEDLALLKTLIDGLAAEERSELEREARQQLAAWAVEPTAAQLSAELARLVLTRYFGPERAGKYWRRS